MVLWSASISEEETLYLQTLRAHVVIIIRLSFKCPSVYLTQNSNVNRGNKLYRSLAAEPSQICKWLLGCWGGACWAGACWAEACWTGACVTSDRGLLGRGLLGRGLLGRGLLDWGLCYQRPGPAGLRPAGLGPVLPATGACWAGACWAGSCWAGACWAEACWAEACWTGACVTSDRGLLLPATGACWAGAWCHRRPGPTGLGSLSELPYPILDVKHNTSAMDSDHKVCIYILPVELMLLE